MTYWRVSVAARGDEAEPLRARLLALAPRGIEERERGAVTELSVYVPETEVEAVVAAFPGAGAEPVAHGWEDAWRAFHRPVEAGGLWIGPPWETPPDPSRAVVVDPGRAFGTGAHPTTRLCVELLAGLDTRGALLDVGCGSGVLAIAGARLGYAPVVAVDVDPVAVETTRENARVNDVVVDASVLDGTVAPLPRADVGVANVLLRPVEAILERLEADAAITSGYLEEDAVDAPAWAHVARRTLDGWAADTWRRRPRHGIRENRLRESTV